MAATSPEDFDTGEQETAEFNLTAGKCVLSFTGKFFLATKARYFELTLI